MSLIQPHWTNCVASSVNHSRVAALAFSLAIAVLGRAEERPLLFEKDIQPILASKCGKCHSANVRKGDLDLSSMPGLRTGGESGESSLAASAAESPLWWMIDGGDMPPENEPQLTDEQRDLIRRWIDSGAQADQPASADEPQLTQHDILPIMLLRCSACHGAQRKDAGLDLRTTQAMRQGGTHGPAIIPGQPDASLAIQRIESEACPPRELLLKFFVKRPPPSEVKLFRDWIAAGAIEVDTQPDVATEEDDLLVTTADRQHWAFQPPVLPAQGRSIDDFLLDKLSSAGLQFAPEAERDTLIRRAFIDLLGRPPALEEWTQWHYSESANWYTEMIDWLLASPHYGQRWGRYWLDLAGYADSEGGVSADPLREVAWKYRDYVIRAFNEDKPYDQFLTEQLAGDELIDHANAPVVTQQMVDNLIATGFLRMGIDQTGSRTMNFVPERLGVIGDALTIVGEGIMGLTLGCAKCHSHKYDPIPHRDYYRFKAIFQGALDEYDWLSFKNRELKLDTPERQQRVAEINSQFAPQVKRLESELKKAETDLQLELLRQHYPDQSVADREATLQALRIADNNRSQPQRILVEMLQQVEVLPDAQQPPSVLAAMEKIARLGEELRRVRQQMEPPLNIRALWDRGAPSPTYVLRRGEHDKPGPLVGPGVPSVLTDGRTPFDVRPPFPGGTPKTGRRLALARWLTQPDHPTTARVMVNRLWYHHFGGGIVATLENFGIQGARPSHPELLDWLAIEFVNRGWSIKQMHRLIMHSRAYRQSSQISRNAQQIDPQNQLLSHMPLQRMNAEALRDSLLFVAGRLDFRDGGPPDPVSVDRNGQVSVWPTTSGAWRRSVYLQFRRTEIPTLLDTFDYPEMGPNCLIRNTSTVAPQSLLLLNNSHIHELAASFADRVLRYALDAPPADAPSGLRSPAMLEQQAAIAYCLALSRQPTTTERQLGVEALQRLTQLWDGDARQALQTYCHTLLNSAGFLYID